MTVPIEAPMIPQQWATVAPPEQSRLQRAVGVAKQYVGRAALALCIATTYGTVLGIGASTCEASGSAYASGAFENNYPDGDAGDCSAAYGPYSWCKGSPPSWLSPRGYGYRNCTDGVADWVQDNMGLALPKNLGDANAWDDNAPASYGVKPGTSNDIEPGDIAQSDDGDLGHVGLVTSVTKDANGHVTLFTTAELNKAGDGNYTANTYRTRNGSNKFTRFGSYDWDHFIDVNGAGKGLHNEAIADGPAMAFGGSEAATLARPAAVTFNDALNVFVRGADGRIYTQYWDGTNWTGFSSLGGNMASDPAVVVNDAALNVFARGADGQIYTKYNDGMRWTGWASMGSTTMRGNPRVVRYNGELDVFALGMDSRPYKNTWQPATGWTGWASLGNYMDSSPLPLQYGSELDVVMRGGDNQIYKDTWNGSRWGGFGTLGCCLQGNPDAIAYGNQLDIWGMAPTGHVWKRTWDGSGWGNWTDMGGNYAGDPDVMQYGDDLNVFVRGTDGHLYARYWSASGRCWSAWASIGGNIAGEPTAIQYGNELTVFATGADGKTYKNTFRPDVGWGTFAALPG